MECFLSDLEHLLVNSLRKRTTKFRICYTIFDELALNYALFSESQQAIALSQQAMIAANDLVIIRVTILSKELIALIQDLEKRQVQFIMLCGVLGMPQSEPLIYPKGHMLVKTESSIEHIYFSPELAQLVTEQDYQFLQPSFIEIFEQQAAYFPDESAVMWNGIQLSYKELDQLAERVARYLSSVVLTEMKEPVIALYLENHPHYIIFVLAIMKAGMAFMPIESDRTRIPLTVVQSMLKSSGVSFVIAHSDPEHNDLPVLLIDPNDLLLENIPEAASVLPEMDPDRLSYRMFTSGSSGTPKGVNLLNRGLTYSFQSHQDCFALNKNDRVLQLFMHSFDAHLMVYGMGLLSAARVYLFEQPLNCLENFILENKITILIAIPKVLEKLNLEKISKTVRGVAVVGDKCNETLKTLLKKYFSISKIGYGLTETTIVTTLGDRNIGTPILGCEVKLYPKELFDVENKIDINEQTPWIQEKKVDGLIMVKGPIVARDYFNLPEKTRERFINGYYMTGDYGCYDEDGTIIWKGRNDNQVKIRGQRIELSGIQQIIQQTGLVEEVHVCVYVLNSRNLNHTITQINQLVLFVVPKEKTLTPEMLQELLKQKLPNFMCPSLNSIQFLERLPRKENDKKSVDEMALKQTYPWPFVQQASEESNLFKDKPFYQLFKKAFLRSLAFAIQEKEYPEQLLSGEAHYFEELGGNSLSAVYLLQYLNQFFPFAKTYPFSVADLEKNPTLNSFYYFYRRKNYDVAKKIKERSALLKSLPKATSDYEILDDFNIHRSQVYQKTDAPIFLLPALLGNSKADYEKSIFQSILFFYELEVYTKVESIDELIEHYVQLIKSKTPEHYVWLFGWSSGGWLAYQVAQKLRQQNYTVFIGMIDTINPRVLPRMPKTQIQIMLEKIRDALWLQNGFSEECKPIFNQGFGLIDGIEWLKKFVPQEENNSTHALDQLEFAKLIITAQLSDKKSFRLLPKDICYISEESENIYDALNLGWFGGTGKMVKNSNHFTILNKISADEINHLIAAELERLNKWVYQASICYEEGNYSLAITYARLALQYNPNDQDARKALIQSLVYSEQFLEASRELEKCSHLGYKYFWLGYVRYKQNSFYSAEQYFLKTITACFRDGVSRESDLRLAQSYYYLGRIYYGENSLIQAQDAFSRALNYYHLFEGMESKEEVVLCQGFLNHIQQQEQAEKNANGVITKYGLFKFDASLFYNKKYLSYKATGSLPLA